MIIYLIIPLTMLCWMAGGQVNKLIRSIGVPVSCIAVGLLAHMGWYVLPLALYGLLAFGYGVKSKLYKWLHDDDLVRIAYGACCTIPIFIIACLRGFPERTMMILFIIGAFEVKAGRLGRIGRYDILWEDIARSLAVSISILAVLL